VCKTVIDFCEIIETYAKYIVHI